MRANERIEQLLGEILVELKTMNAMTLDQARDPRELGRTIAEILNKYNDVVGKGGFVTD